MAPLRLASLPQQKHTSLSFPLQMFTFEEDGMCIIYCPALDLSAYDHSIAAAKKAFETVLDETVQDWIEQGTLLQDLTAHGWRITQGKTRHILPPSPEELMHNNTEMQHILANKHYASYSQDVQIPNLA
jgi:hypothetical protein